MNLFDYFSQLEYVDKFHILWEDGIFLSYYRGERHSVNLFSLDGFYVEVYYNESNDEILYINAFEDINLLEKYLENININEILYDL